MPVLGSHFVSEGITELPSVTTATFRDTICLTRVVSVVHTRMPTEVQPTKEPIARGTSIRAGEQTDCSTTYEREEKDPKVVSNGLITT